MFTKYNFGFGDMYVKALDKSFHYNMVKKDIYTQHVFPKKVIF